MASFLVMILAISLPLGTFGRCPSGNDQLKRGTFCKLWDEDDCTGWEYESGPGYHEFSSFGGKSDDAEAAAVAPGCILTLYDEDADDVEDRGEKLVIDNSRGNRLMVRTDLKGLDEDVEAFDCDCGCANINFPPGVDCIVWDGKSCRLDDWDEARMYTGNPGGQTTSGSSGGILSSILGGGKKRELLSEESFSLVRGGLNLSNRKLKNAIRSVAVRAGAELIVFDDSDFTDDAYSFRADQGRDIFIDMETSQDPAVRSLAGDVESLRCKRLGFTNGNNRNSNNRNNNSNNGRIRNTGR